MIFDAPIPKVNNSAGNMKSPTKNQNDTLDSASCTNALGWQQNPGWTQAASRTIRSEEVIIGPQAALLEVRGDQYEAALLVNGQVNAFHWCDGEGSVGQNLVATQPVSKLSAARVAQLSEEIQKGARPAVITISAEQAWCEFIIDGHHKVSAYRRTNVPAVRLNIIRRNSERLSLQDASKFVPEIDGLRRKFIEKRPA